MSETVSDIKWVDEHGNDLMLIELHREMRNQPKTRSGRLFELHTLLCERIAKTELALASALDTIEAVKAVEEWRAREPYARRYSVSESGARAWVWHQMRWQEWRSADSLSALGRMLKGVADAPLSSSPQAQNTEGE